MAPGKQVQGVGPPSTNRAWDGLTPALADWVLEAVSHMGFDRMTPVQASTIPLFMGNKDVVVEAVTGSGKTLSFLIPVVEKLLRLEDPIKKHHVGAIIISPTRELATQIHTVLLSLLAFHPPSAAHLTPQDPDVELGESSAPEFPSSALKVIPQLLLGGSTTTSQDLSHFLKNSPNLLISTPGRLLELLSSPHVHCPQSSFEVLVLDEADRLLDLGFKVDLQKILQRLPKQRRTGLFSASVSEAVDQLVRVGLRNPVRIAVKVRGRDGKEEQMTPASLQMTYLTTPPTAKLPTLLSLLQNLTPQPQKSIAYLSTCAAVDYFSHILPHLLALPIASSPALQKLNVIPLHGKQSATHRNRQFTAFVTSTSPTLLLTTDVAARGLDIPSVDLTVQLDPPSDPKTFLHRAGRAGRAGRKGLAVVFLLPGRESEGYPSFLSVRKTPVAPLVETSISKIADIVKAGSEATLLRRAVEKIRAAVLKDRALHDKAQRGFVSWVRSYSKHAASSIFRVADLRWRDEAEAWGLLRLPRMPELKLQGSAAESEDGATPREIDRSLGLTIDWPNFRYKDVQQERKRQAEMKAAAEGTATGRETKRKEKSAWSSKHDQQATAVARREKKARRREKERWEKMSEEERKKAAEVEEMVGKVRATIVGA